VTGCEYLLINTALCIIQLFVFQFFFWGRHCVMLAISAQQFYQHPICDLQIRKWMHRWVWRRHCKISAVT